VDTVWEFLRTAGFWPWLVLLVLMFLAWGHKFTEINFPGGGGFKFLVPSGLTEVQGHKYDLELRTTEGDAEPLYKRALLILEKAHSPDHPIVGATRNNLALLYHMQGRYADAEPLYKRVLSIAEAAHGPDHPIVGASLNNLALLYCAQGRYAAAEPFLKRALLIAEAAHGPGHPDVGQSLDNLARLYHDEGRTADAEPLYKRALSIVEEVLGSDHPHVGTTLNNLAGLYRAQGRNADAERLYKRAEEIPGWEVADVPILFATNRRPEPIDGWVSFSALQEGDVAKISFGKATVRAAKSEVLNRAGRFAEALGQRDRVIGRQTSVADLAVRKVELDPNGSAASAAARDRLSRAARFPGQAFVFVHGYNTTFENAVRRTAMIAFDLDFDGAMFLFTWPSHARLAAYGTDRKRARVAAPFLVELLYRIGAQLPDVKLHVLAHSTGAEIALSALTELADKPRQTGRPRLGELVLAHADVDPARLERAMPSLRKLGIGVTSYSSAIDWAMRISQAIRLLTRSRVGAGPVHIEDVDAIDITGLSGGPLELNHTVFVDNPMVFGDMHRLMATGERPPDRRTAFFTPVKTQRGTHWIYKKHDGKLTAADNVDHAIA
jgi:esterase/lipase superfamily enzyme